MTKPPPPIAGIECLCDTRALRVGEDSAADDEILSIDAEIAGPTVFRILPDAGRIRGRDAQPSRSPAIVLPNQYLLSLRV